MKKRWKIIGLVVLIVVIVIGTTYSFILRITILDQYGQCLANPESRPLSISNFRRVSVDMYGSSFTWGNESQLIYSRRELYEPRLYLHDLSSGKITFLSKGTSPVFRKEQDHDTIYFLKSTGYSDDNELWEYSIYPKVQGEAKVSSAIIRASHDIYLSPVDVHTFAYRYSCCMAEGGFNQIRLTTIKRYRETYIETKILYSKPLGRELPSIAGWIDGEHLICFIKEEPYVLSTTSGLMLFPKSEVNREKQTNYPAKKSEALTNGLKNLNKIILPASNFTPDGRSYIVYSKERNSLIQRSLDGKEIFSTALPKAVEYYSYQYEHPKFSRDGRHICFVGLVTTGDGHKKPTLWIADVRPRKE